MDPFICDLKCVKERGSRDDEYDRRGVERLDDADGQEDVDGEDDAQIEKLHTL